MQTIRAPQTTRLPDTAWKGLYRAGALAALLVVFIFRPNISAEIDLTGGLLIFGDLPATPPVRAAEWFNLLQRNRLTGLALLDVFDLVNYLLVGLVFLALYAALREIAPGLMLTAIPFGFLGIGLLVTSNPAFPMLSLSQQYAATDAVQRTAFLVAGEILLVNHRTVGYLGLFLVLLAGLLISLAMLRSPLFGRAAAVSGLLANGIYLFFFLTLAFAPALIWLPPTLAAPIRLVWYFLIAWRLVQMSK